MMRDRKRADLDLHIAANFLQRLLEVLSYEPRQNLVRAFSEVGIDFDQFKQQPKQHIHTDLYVLLHTLNQPQYFPGITLKFGLAREILDLGVLGFTILSCSDIRQAMTMIIRYHSLTAEAYQMTMTEHGDHAFSGQWIKPQHRHNRVEIDEEHITGVWRVLRTVLPQSVDMTAVSIHLGFPEPDYGQLYREIFEGELLFGQKETLISFPREWLDFPIQSADEIVGEACRTQCEVMLEKLSIGSMVVDDVRRLILSRPRTQSMRVQDVASSMRLTVRSLERRLKAAGSSFRDIDNEIRMGLAEEYLRLGYLSGKEIAYMLDYSQPSTFYRAFKNWFGKTPRQFRENPP
jgi:AraC-like DNA-binding protein